MLNEYFFPEPKSPYASSREGPGSQHGLRALGAESSLHDLCLPQESQARSIFLQLDPGGRREYPEAKLSDWRTWDISTDSGDQEMSPRICQGFAHRGDNTRSQSHILFKSRQMYAKFDTFTRRDEIPYLLANDVVMTDLPMVSCCIGLTRLKGFG